METCSVCLCDFDNLFKTQCGHCFCIPCLKKLIRHKIKKFPYCRKDICANDILLLKESKVIYETCETCTFCFDAVEHPFKITCGHGMCFACVKELFKNSINCPECNTLMTAMDIARVLRKPNNVKYFYLKEDAEYVLRDPLASVMEIAFLSGKSHFHGLFRWGEIILDTQNMELLRPRTHDFIADLCRYEKTTVINRNPR
jgi:hypothetical protein